MDDPDSFDSIAGELLANMQMRDMTPLEQFLTDDVKSVNGGFGYDAMCREAYGVFSPTNNSEGITNLAKKISSQDIISQDIISKETNPKDAVGSRKASMRYVPVNVMLEQGLCLQEGGLKYGAHNYRDAGVRASVYYDALWRHMGAWWEGEDIDRDSALSHVAKGISTLIVLRDAMMNDMWEDDRPIKCKNQNWVQDANDHASMLIDKFPTPKQPFLQKNKNSLLIIL